jgi:two-component system sensor histidine kinase KdpD
MTDERPSPDSLLIPANKEGSTKGKLRVYFGYAAGVGKSYAMLKGAHELKAQHIDVVVGYLEAHGRAETEGLLLGLPQIPPMTVKSGSAAFKELDLDAVLKRNPQVVLIDELAHTNTEGCRHNKRWQDVNELLEAGISVYTTVNVQHLASLNDIVSRITGVSVRETVPDGVFDQADEVTLVDITPDELLKRFQSGKVYHGAQAELAVANFFKKSNLVALREIALRRTAERVHADVDLARLTSSIQTVIPTQERLCCLIDSDNASLSALRATARLASMSQCPWYALDVESSNQISRLPSEEKKYQVAAALVEELGGKTVRLSGVFRISEALRWARKENITKFLIARPAPWDIQHWLERTVFFLFGSDLDIIWVSGNPEKAGPVEKIPDAQKKFVLRPYIETTGIVLFTFLVAAVLGALKAPEANLTVIYLLGVILAAVIHGEGASAWAAFLSAFCLGFGLTNFTWRVSWENSQYLVDFGISLIIGLLASQMTSRLKTQAEIAQREREQTESLYNFTMALSEAMGLHQIAATTKTFLEKTFDREVVLLLPDDKNAFKPLLVESTTFMQSPNMLGVAEYVAQNGRPAGAWTQTLPKSRALYLPLTATSQTVGILVIAREKKSGEEPPPPPLTYFERFTQPLAARIEGALVAENAEKIYWQAERERLRSDLLTSVSEGLKKPLSEIVQASEKLLIEETRQGPGRTALMVDLHDEALRLHRSIDNLTHFMRSEHGELPVHTQRVELNRFVREETGKIQKNRLSHEITIQTPLEATYVEIDPLLFSQVIFNIIDNAVEYTPTGGNILVKTAIENDTPRLIIEDDGPGIPEDQLEKIFEKYYRLSSRSRGAGLGLTVCRAIVEAHGARMWAENRSPQGLKLVVELKKE